jgi:transcriptional regulator with XRE-family HTH domain
MKLGEKLKKLRDDRGMSMYRLTQMTGVSGHHIKGIEQGTRQPTIETLNKLVNALGSSLADIFSDDDNSVRLAEDERRLIENYRMVSEEKKSALLNMSDLLKK